MPGCRNSSAEPDTRLYQKIEYPGAAAAIMFTDEYAHSFIEHPHIIHTSLAGAFSFKMDNAAACKIIILVPRFLDTITQVHIFTIHKEYFIKSTRFVKHFFFDHHECAGQYIYFMVFIFIQVTEVIFCKYF